MSFQLSPISEYKTFVSIDIGSYRVRATAWKIESGELVCIAHVSLRQNRGAWLHGAIADMRSVADTISRAIAEIGEKIEYIPEDIILSFPSDAILSDIITSQYVRADRESTITMEEIDAMIQRIERQSHDKMLSKMPKYLWATDIEMRLVTSNLVSIYIDGKRITNPIWFTGKNIKFTVLNCFAPATDFNIMRSIAGSLSKKTISMVPLPLVIPKTIEKTAHNGWNIVYIHIGHSQTTIILESQSEILGFHTVRYGMETVHDDIAKIYPEISSIERETLINNYLEHRENPDNTPEYIAIDIALRTLFQIIVSALRETILVSAKDFLPKYIFFSGGVSTYSESVKKYIAGELTTDIWNQIHIAPLPVPTDIDTDTTITYGLGLIALELLLLKKDPVIRILRYILYKND